MSLHEAAVAAGVLSTLLFVASYLPMLVRAARTRDLSSYSVGNLVLANVGNVVHTGYVLSLPPGPLWALHGFYLASSALMLLWWWRYREVPGSQPARTAEWKARPGARRLQSYVVHRVRCKRSRAGGIWLLIPCSCGDSREGSARGAG